MSWIGGNCQKNKRFECYYAALNNFDQQWCIDSDASCQDFNDGGGLVKVVDHQAPAKPWYG
ncbi:MAG: hypothetical protein ACJ8AD_20175 [Gemmatimonadaceae bacterium]